MVEVESDSTSGRNTTEALTFSALRPPYDIVLEDVHYYALGESQIPTTCLLRIITLSDLRMTYCPLLCDDFFSACNDGLLPI